MKIIREKFKFNDYNLIKKEVNRVWKAIISVEKYEESLSPAQRKYYFWVVVTSCMADEQWGGYTKDEVHHELKIQYLPDYQQLLEELWNYDDLTEMMKRFLNLHHDLTITTRSKWEFESYLSRIRAWEARKWIYIPLPNESNWWDWAELVK